MLSRRDVMGLLPFAASGARRAPNLILIYADDLGYGDLGCYGGRIRTPHLDRLAKEGMRFTQCLSANPVCSPSRAALLTGRYPTRVKIPRVLFPRDREGLPEDETTIAAMLKPQGYRTHCVGKWHLGHHPEHLPTSRGFDGYFGIPYSNDMDPPVLLRSGKGGVEIVEQRAAMDRLAGRYAEEAVKFIDSAKDSPFFLYFPHTFPHIPLGASARFRGKSAQGLYGDVVEELDWGVGQVWEAVKRHGLDRETLIVFSSDNGPWYQGSPGPLRGRKGATLEGGVRVPLIARMPGTVAANRVSDELVSTMDVLPTFARLSGAKLPAKPLDGADLLPLLTGREQRRQREALLYFDGWNAQCIRDGNLKLHVARYNSQVYSPAPAAGRLNLPLPKPELYDLAIDPNESYDIAPERPADVERLQKKMEQMIAGFPAEVRDAWAQTRARPTAGDVGAFPRIVQ
ncbi:MAG: sulfatase [Bryobacter sp.]|jgi:arylsulfatase A|nr:sulfatase [Bryobacter sp. CoA8 C33]